MRRAGMSFLEIEDATIKEMAGSFKAKEIADRLGRSVRSVETRIGKLGLRRYDTRQFSAEEDAVIRASRGRTSVDVGNEIGRSPGCVRGRARRLGLGDWKEWGGGLKEYRGYKVERIERGDGSLSRRVPEHRAIMERHLGRSLADQERVHHINCKKRDNRIENLHLFATSIDHIKCHHSLNALVPELLELGIISFDKKTGSYKISAGTE